MRLLLMRDRRSCFVLVLGSVLFGCGDDGVDASGTDTGSDSSSTSSAGDSTGVTADETTGDTTGSTDTGSTAGGSTESSTGTDAGDSDESSTTASESSESSTGVATMCDPEDLGSALGEIATGSTVASGDDIHVDCMKFDSVEREFLWTAPAAGSYQFDTQGSAFDTAIAVLAGGCDGEMLACNDDFDELESAVLVDLAANETVLLVVDGYGGDAGDFVLHVSEGTPGECCSPSLFNGCDDPTCEDAVCAIDPTCCTQEWTSDCANDIAPEVCAQCAPPGSCCFAHVDPSCDDDSCAADVCDTDPSCCDTEWTQACADLATTTCNECMPGVGDCCQQHDDPGCFNLQCEDIVCALNPWCCDQLWDAGCAQTADDLCPVCQPPGPCCFPNGAPGCQDDTVEQCVCAVMPECCSGAWTPECVATVEANACGTCEVGDLSCVLSDLGMATGEVATGTNVGAGDDLQVECAPAGGQDVVYTWTAPSSGPWSFDTFGSDYDVALAIMFPDCAGDTLACEGAFMQTGASITLEIAEGVQVLVALDGFGADAGNYVLNINPPAGEGFCCVAHQSGGCDVASCQATVCAADPSCCNGLWDEACANLAQAECAVCMDGAAGDCCDTHEGAGCGDLDCAETVCTQWDPYCCNVEWAAFCVDGAQNFCGC